MSKINCLPREVAELIAAGEVIERPASIVKELIENAIDAKASRITVEIKNGGISYIRVSDNGCGISAEDIPTAFIRHATSKVSTKEDLDRIMTMGFRGEALPSIAAVSRVEVTSREEEEIIGTRFMIQGADNGEIQEIGCPVGTTVVVRDLFYNVPARIKFLKKDVVEGNTVAGIVEKIALANPAIGITFIREGVTRFSTPGDGRLITVIRLVMGSDFSSAMVPAQWEDDAIKVWGYITKATASRANRTAQHFIINGRYVRSKTCTSALEEAYRMRLMGGRFPGCVLNVSLKPQNVDVNVHPAKLEVRFSDERMVYNAVYAACKNALDNLESRPAVKQFNPFTLTAEDEKNKQVSFETPIVNANPRSHLDDFGVTIKHEELSSRDFSVEKIKPIALDNPFSKDKNDQLKEGYFKILEAFSVEDKEELPQEISLYTDINPVKQIDFTDNTIQDESEEKTSLDLRLENLSQQLTEEHYLGDDSTEQSIDRACSVEAVLQGPIDPIPNRIEFRVLGEVFDCFILCEAGKELVLVDKHAAHERWLYNQLRQDIDADSRQLALTNSVILLRGDDYRTLTENSAMVEKLGIAFADIGDGAIIVKELALVLVDFPIQAILEDIAEHIRQNTAEITPMLLDELLFSVSCRCAVMAGKKSGYEDLVRLAEMAINGTARHCPHGRPTTISMTQNEIQRMFGRT